MDVAASDAVLDDKPSEKTTMDGQAPASYAQARLAEMVLRGKLRRLEFDTRRGKLVEAAVVKERWAAILVVMKERILPVPDKLAPKLTALPTSAKFARVSEFRLPNGRRWGPHDQKAFKAYEVPWTGLGRSRRNAHSCGVSSLDVLLAGERRQYAVDDIMPFMTY